MYFKKKAVFWRTARPFFKLCYIRGGVPTEILRGDENKERISPIHSLQSITLLKATQEREREREFERENKNVTCCSLSRGREGPHDCFVCFWNPSFSSFASCYCLLAPFLNRHGLVSHDGLKITTFRNLFLFQEVLDFVLIH